MKTSCHNPTNILWRLVSPLLLLLLFAIPAEALAQDVLFVYNAGLNTGEEDKDEDFQYLSILEDELGLTVHLINAADASTADADGVDLIFISESVGSGDVADKFKNTNVPIVNAEVFTFLPGRMEWVSSELGIDVDMGFTNANKINIANTDHPILGGLRPGEITVYDAPPAGSTLGNDADNQIGYAVPLPGGDVLATLPAYTVGPGSAPLPPSSGQRATLFTYEAGDVLHDGTTVPARYVGFFAHTRGSENLSEVGQDLFANSVLWALGKDADLREISAPAPTILFVYEADMNTGAEDRDEDFRYLEILEDELGFNVQPIDAGAAAPGDTVGVDAIFISESVGSGDVAGKFKGVRMPIVNAEVFTWTPERMAWIPSDFIIDVDMGFATANKIQVASKDHPILGGLPSYEVTVYDDPPAGSTLGNDAANLIGYAVPAPDAEIIATLPSAISGPDGQPLPPSEGQRASMFVFEPGDQLSDGSTVWARRASFFAHTRGSENLSDIGEALFRNTMLWAVGRDVEAESIDAPAPTMLFVYDASVNTGVDDRDEDFRYLELLEDSLGFQIQLIDHGQVTREDTVGVDAILISESVSSGNVGGIFKGVPLPIINAEVFTWTTNRMFWVEPDIAIDVDMGFANSNSIVIEDVDHPILGGLRAGELVVYNDPPAGSTLGNDASNQVGYGVAFASGDVLATLPDDAIGPDGNPMPPSDFTRATLFTYERGDTMVSNDTLLTIAPARRVGFFAHTRGSENLNEAGEKLFMNAVAWATGREVEVRPITTVSNERGTELPNSFAIESVYPNPFNPAATVELSIREAGPYEVNVYDVLGRIVQKHAFNISSPGQQHVALDMASQASGMYLIQVVQTMTGKAAVTRAVLLK